MTAQESADAVALRALGWLLEDASLRDAFLHETGVSPADLRRLVSSRVFLAAVVDFVLADDRRVLDFCAACDFPPKSLAQVRSSLPGGDLPNWT